MLGQQWVYIDTEWQKIYGDYKGRKCYEYFMGRTEACTKCGIKKALETKQVLVSEEILVREGHRPIQVTTMPFQNEKGEWLVAEVNVDITERKQNEEKLRASEEELQGIVATVPGAVYQFWGRKDGSLGMIYLSDQAEKIVGEKITLEAFVERFIAMVVPEQRESFVQSIQKAVKEVSEWRFEWKMKKPSGELIWLSAHSIPVVSGDEVIFSGVFQDITERKNAEENLRETEKRFLDVFYTARDAAFLIDRGTFTDCNKVGVQMFGYSTQRELLGKHPAQISPLMQPDGKKSSEKAGEMVEIAFREGYSRFEWIHQKVNGESFPAEVSLTPILLHGKKMLHCICRDLTEIKRAEEALMRVTDRLSLATRAGGVGIWDYDVIDNKLIWDDQMYRLYGITAKTFSGAYDAWQAGLHPEDRQRGDEEILSALRGEKEFDTEFRVLWPDGTIRNIRALAIVQRDASGKPAHMIGTNWDITAQKVAEEGLRQSSEMVRLLLNSTAEAIYGLDREGRCTFINAACLKILGYERPEQLLGKNMHDEIHAKRADGNPYDVNDCPIFKAFREERETHVDNEVLWRRDGIQFSAEYWSYPIRQEGKVIGAVVTFIDITERKKTERALRDSEEKFRIVFENAAVAIMFADGRERLSFWNPFTESMLQMNSADLAQKQVSALYPDEEWAKIRSLGIRDKGMIHHLETRMIREGGSCLDVDISISVLRDPEGKITGSIGIARDISDRKRAEESLIELTNAKTKFASTVSHELRSPLAAIKAATDLVREGSLGPVNAEQEDILDSAKSNIDRLGRLINNVLVYQKIDAGRMTYDLTEGDVNAVILDVVKNTKLFAGVRAADFVVELTEDLPRIKFDKDRIFQVLTNLMTNAVKYTESGSIVIRARREAHELRVSVQDFGPGIGAEDFGKLFEPFSPLSDNQRGGTGLGLAISKEIALAHHGKIWVESEVGKGSTFHFTLPI